MFERLASRVLYADESLRTDPATLASNELGRSGLWRHGISGDLPILLVRVSGEREDQEGALVRHVLQAQEYWRLKGLSADVVILNDHPVSYLDEMQELLNGLLDNGPWRSWKQQPGGVFLLRGDQIGKAERTLFESVARAVLRGEHGISSCATRQASSGRPEARPDIPVACRVGGGRSDRCARVAGHARDRLFQRARRLRQRRPGLRRGARCRTPDACSVGEHSGQPALRHDRDGIGRRAHVVRQQP